MGFAAAFRNQGRFADFMGNFSVTILMDAIATLTGCAAFLAQRRRG